MKKIFKLFAVAAMMFGAAGVANAERVETPVNKMPAQVQTFLNDYYPGVQVSSSWAKMMRPTTEPMWWRVNLADGTKLQFDLQGNWNMVNAKHSDSSVSIDLLPNEARKVISTMQEQYPGETIKAIKFKKDCYKVTLSGGQKLKFDKTYGLKVKKHKKGAKGGKRG